MYSFADKKKSPVSMLNRFNETYNEADFSETCMRIAITNGKLFNKASFLTEAKYIARSQYYHAIYAGIVWSSCHVASYCPHYHFIKWVVPFCIWWKLIPYGANVWRGRILTNLMNQSFIVKIFLINILSASTCNIYGSCESSYWSRITSISARSEVT